MSIDAVALLRIARLEAPHGAFGQNLVEHRSNASLLHTFANFHGAAPDELALSLRGLLGATLDNHDDPRGILFFPDICEPKGKTYEAIVSEVASAGAWAPNVDLSHVPARYAAPKSSHDALLSSMILAMGRDPALQFDSMAQVNLLTHALDEYRSSLEELAATMGAAFASSYDESVRGQLDAQLAAQAAHFANAEQLYARMTAGESLLSSGALGDITKKPTNARGPAGKTR